MLISCFHPQALTLIQLLSHHKAGQKYAESGEAAGFAVRALVRVTGRAIKVPLSKQLQQPALVKKPSLQQAALVGGAGEAVAVAVRPDEDLYADVSAAFLSLHVT